MLVLELDLDVEGVKEATGVSELKTLRELSNQKAFEF